jgi:threonyl-tRNA synthetase
MRRLGSQERRSIGLEEAIASLVGEARPPDARRSRAARPEAEPEQHLTLDGHHVLKRTVS